MYTPVSLSFVKCTYELHNIILLIFDITLHYNAINIHLFIAEYHIPETFCCPKCVIGNGWYCHVEGVRVLIFCKT